MPVRKESRRIAFNVGLFLKDIRVVCKERGVSISKMAEEIGVSASTMSYMQSQGCVPDGINLAALIRWTGLDLGKYSIDLEYKQMDRENWQRPRRAGVVFRSSGVEGV